MKLKNFLWLLEVLTVVFWVIFLLILFFVNPYKSEANVFILFFVSLLFAFAGTWSIIEFSLKVKFKGMEDVNKKILTSFRHGAMISLVGSGLLFMQGIGVLKFWDGIIFVLAVVLFEAYFLTRTSFVAENKEK